MFRKLLTLTLFLGGSLLLFALIANKGSVKVSDGVSAFYTVGVAHAYDDSDGSGPGQGCGGCGVGTGSGPGSADGGGGGGGSVDNSGLGHGFGTFGACPGWCGGGNDSGGNGSPSGTMAPTCPDGSLQPTEQSCSENGGCVTMYDPCPTPPPPPPSAPTCPDGSVQPSHKNCNFTSIFAALCPVIYDACPTTQTTNTTSPPPTSPTNLSGSCTDTAATVSWSGGSTDTSYDLRINDTTDGWSDVGPCSAQSPNDVCIDNYSGTSKTFTGQLGHTYTWWVHGVNATGDVSDPTGGPQFTCVSSTPPEPPSTFTATCNAAAGTPLTLAWSASPGATVYAASLILPTGASCPDASWTTTLMAGGYVGCQKAVSGYTVAATIPLDTPITAAVYAGNPASGYNKVPSPASGANITCSLPPTVTLSASPNAIDLGDPSTLTWTAQHATACSFQDAPSKPVSSTGGSRVVHPTDTPTATYQINCTGPGGAAHASTPITVVVPTVSITATPTRTGSDNTTTVSWKATDVDTCDITRNGTAWKSNLLATAGHTVSGSSPDTIAGQTVYKITCEDRSAKTQADSVVVNTGSGGFQEF